MQQINRAPRHGGGEEHARWSPAAARSPGSRRAPAAPARAPSAPPTGSAAARRWAPSPATTPTARPRRSAGRRCARRSRCAPRRRRWSSSTSFEPGRAARPRRPSSRSHQAPEARRTRWSSTRRPTRTLHRSVRNLAKFDVLPPEGVEPRRRCCATRALRAHPGGRQGAARGRCHEPLSTSSRVRSSPRSWTAGAREAPPVLLRRRPQGHQARRQPRGREAVQGHGRGVRTNIVRGKIKRVGRSIGKRPNFKKAIVTLKEGDKIELFEGGTA